ncbi:MAG: hypothetical protein Tsb0010_05420 [Parvularculaceae bacterium]
MKMMRSSRRAARLLAGGAMIALGAGAAGAQEPPAQAAQTPPAQAEEARIVVAIHGAKDRSGRIACAIYDSEETFLDTLASGGVSEIDETGRGACAFTVKAGADYAVSAFHDRNDDGALNSNLLGAPSERFGFSNNAMGRFGPPSFDQAKFRAEAPETALTITLHGLLKAPPAAPPDQTH